jgi:hypothetical protein
VPYIEDLILKVSSSGKIERTFSVPEILYDGGLKPLLTANAKFNPTYLSQNWDRELVHLNKVAVLEPDRAGEFLLFDEGDLLLSIREMNLVLVVDPLTLDVKWHQTGPWLRQHDPEFDKEGNIVVFNNNTFRDSLLPGDKSNIKMPRISNIMSVDPLSGEAVIEFGGKSSQEFLSVIRGKVDLTDDGGFLITEFEAGRVFEVDEDGAIVWEYINRYDEENVAEITEARLYRRGYFKVADWVCD